MKGYKQASLPGWDSYWIERSIWEMTTDHIPNLPFPYFEDPIVMQNDERLLTAFVEEHPNFAIDEACRMLSMDAVRLTKAMRRVGLTLEWRDVE